MALEDCKVLLVLDDDRRDAVLSSAFDPMPGACQRQEVSADSGYVGVHLGRQALGAGGCCATEGTWRSRNGRDWQRREKDRWVDEASTASRRGER